MYISIASIVMLTCVTTSGFDMSHLPVPVPVPSSNPQGQLLESSSMASSCHTVQVEDRSTVSLLL